MLSPISFQDRSVSVCQLCKKGAVMRTMFRSLGIFLSCSMLAVFLGCGSSGSNTNNNLNQTVPPVISAVTSWAAGAGNYGFLLHDASSGTAWKRLIASEQGGSNVPTLSITYNLPAATPTSPISANWTSSRTLSWSYYDQSAIGETSYAVTVATDSSFTSPIVSTGWVASAATSYSIPASTTLTDGTTYWWKVQVKAGTDVSAESSASFKWDSVAPVWGGFTAPTAAVDQAGSSFTFAWNAATDANSGVAGYSVLLESAQIGSLNTCSTNWDESGTPTTVTGLSYVASNLAASTCYRLRVLAKDAAGNPVSSPTYSYSATILRDATPPDAPTVDDNCASIKTCYRVGDTIYYLPSASATVHLTSTGADPESGIVSSSFGAISPSTGWTYTSGTVSGNPASKDVEWSTSAGGVTLAVTTTNGAGVPSAARTSRDSSGSKPSSRPSCRSRVMASFQGIPRRLSRVQSSGLMEPGANQLPRPRQGSEERQ